MCIVIDTCTMSHVFNSRDVMHADFLPIKRWIENGHGFLVFGGTRYKRELSEAYRYLKLIRQMKDAGQAIPICDRAVDTEERRIEQLTAGTDCDDQHLIALLAVSWCTLFCSTDRRADHHIKSRRLYPTGMKRVRVYHSARNASRLLTRMTKQHLRNVV